MTKKKTPAVASTGWEHIPDGYGSLRNKYRALLKQHNDQSAEYVKCIEDEERANVVCGILEKQLKGTGEKLQHVESERDLALSGKAGAEQREAAALEYGRELAASESELRGQVANLETRLAWAENGRHVLERRFYEFALSKGATLEELREQFPGYRIDHRGTVA